MSLTGACRRSKDAILNSTVPYLAVLLLLTTLTGASCPRRLPPPASVSPVIFAQPPTLAEIIAAINANTNRAQRLQVTNATLHVAGLPALRTSLALERPRRLRLQAGTGLTGTELDLGSNDELFWLWARRNEPPAIYFGRHAELTSGVAREILPVPPSWLIEALGLITIDTTSGSSVWQGPFVRGPGRLEIRGQVATTSGLLIKVIVVDDRRGTIVEQQVYDERGQLLASALATRSEFDAAHQVSLPLQIDIQLPPAQLSFTLEVDGYLINYIGGDPAQLWSMPQFAGTNAVPLSTSATVGPVGWRTGAEFMPR